MHDTDNAPPDVPAQPAPLVQQSLIFTCPAGFEVGGYMIVAIDAQGQPFTNAPPDVSLALHLAQIAVSYTTRRAITSIQAKESRSTIVAPPSGLTIPPWISGRS